MKEIKQNINILACPDCDGKLKILSNQKLSCKKCKKKFKIIDNIPVLLPSDILEEQKRAIRVWGEEYRQMLKNHNFNYQDKYAQADTREILKNKGFKKNSSFLEIGCGRARNCATLAKKGFRNIVGLDISIDALRLAKAICNYHKIKNCFFVVGDIYRMPFQKNSFDLVFGGGSMEHFEDTLGGFQAVYQTITKDGELIATVPFVSLSTLPQAFLTGNTPKIPIIQNIYKYYHTHIKKDKNLMYGFEYSFLASDLECMTKKAGFKKFSYNFYDVKYDLKFIPPKIKKLALKIIRNRAFWPMITIRAKK